MRQLPIELKIVKSRVNFLVNLSKSSNVILKICSNLDDDKVKLCEQYLIESDVDKQLWSYLEKSFNIIT